MNVPMITRQIAATKTPPTILSSSCSKCFSINPSSHLNASNPIKTSKAITPNIISLKKKIKGIIYLNNCEHCSLI